MNLSTTFERYSIFLVLKPLSISLIYCNVNYCLLWALATLPTYCLVLLAGSDSGDGGVGGAYFVSISFQRGKTYFACNGTLSVSVVNGTFTREVVGVVVVTVLNFIACPFACKANNKNKLLYFGFTFFRSLKMFAWNKRNIKKKVNISKKLFC